jgi:hypothetical protein
MNNKYQRIGVTLSLLTIISALMVNSLEQKNPYVLVWTWVFIGFLGVVTLVVNDVAP